MLQDGSANAAIGMQNATLVPSAVPMATATYGTAVVDQGDGMDL